MEDAKVIIADAIHTVGDSGVCGGGRSSDIYTVEDSGVSGGGRSSDIHTVEDSGVCGGGRSSDIHTVGDCGVCGDVEGSSGDGKQYDSIYDFKASENLPDRDRTPFFAFNLASSPKRNDLNDTEVHILSAEVEESQDEVLGNKDEQQTCKQNISEEFNSMNNVGEMRYFQCNIVVSV